MIRFLQTDNRVTKALMVVIIGAASVSMCVYLIPGLMAGGSTSADTFAVVYPHWYSKFLATGDEVSQVKVEEVARLLHIESKLQNKATQLSGGQMQRVAIGRALVRSPAIYLMDEPLSSLDAKLRGEMRLELKRIQTVLGATILYVTHDQTEAMTMASRIGVIEAGRLMQIGTPREIYENPINAHVAARLGQPAINFLPAKIFAGAPRGASTIGARTEHLTIARGSGDVSATVRRIEHLGDQSHLHLDLGGRPVVTLANPEATFGAGDIVSLCLNNPLFFDAGGRRIAA